MSWAGWYAGLNAGYLGDVDPNPVSTGGVLTSLSVPDSNNTALAQSIATTMGSKGAFMGGAQFGYNYQYAARYIVGFEADIQSSTVINSNSAAFGASTVNAGFLSNFSTSRQLEYFGTLRGRVGATYTPTTLLYVTGGLAYAGLSSSTNGLTQGITITPPPGNGVTSGSFSGTRFGYAVGAGGEWMFMRNWSAKLEYLYLDLGTVSYATGGVAFDVSPSTFPGGGISAAATSTSIRLADHIVRVGVNHHFYGP